HLGRLGLDHHRVAAAHLPGPEGVVARRHGPDPGDPARRCRGPGPCAVRELLRPDHGLAAARRGSRRVPRRAGLEPGTGRPHSPRPRRTPARIRVATARPADRARAARRDRRPRRREPRLGRDPARGQAPPPGRRRNIVNPNGDAWRTPPGARGAVVFLTGLSGSGKSTIAEALAADLRAAGREVSIVDGDVLRQHVSANLGFDAASREANVRRAAELAAGFAADGQIVISALIAPFERSRREARAIVESVAPFLLVYVSTPLEVAEA